MAAKKTKTTVIDPGQYLTIDHTPVIHKQFMEAIQKKQGINIVSSSIENVDLSGIQFIIFAQRYAKKNNIEISIDLKIAESARTLVDSCGFKTLFPA